jgi:hypothetical protein|tara:strand:+ start:14160 stop:15377 length:1218 start_codon:yes stop_codon:yes gene_type:complete
MATFKTISSDDIKETTSVLNQLVDFVEEDVSGSATRKKFQVFVTSSGANAVTSSLFQTVYDQDFKLQTANELFDMTVGLYHNSETVTGSRSDIDANGKFLFPSQSMMMREKVNIYKQFSQLLLGDSSLRFTAPFSNATAGTDEVDEALFVSFKRLFVRDGIKRETFAIKMFQSSSDEITEFGGNIAVNATVSPPSGSAIYTDVGSSTSVERSSTGGDVGNIVNAANTAITVGLMFYQQGVAVFDMKKAFDGNQLMRGSIDSVGEVGLTHLEFHERNNKAHGNFIPGFIVSASIDQILNHVSETRFGSGSNTFLTFQNNTKINSTLYFCRATADEFNFSTNPSYTNAEGRIRVIDTGQEDIEKSFSFVTTVGLYDANEELLAVAKLSRPVEKNDEKDLTFRVRLDF